MNTLDYNAFYQAQHDSDLKVWLQSIQSIVTEQSQPTRHGHFPGWLAALHALPEFNTENIDLTSERITVTSKSPNTQLQRQINETLLQLKPWRKGPFQIDDLFIDSEWKSNLKWDRIKNHISSLQGRNVLDVGCGNGYYGYRMLGAGAKTVVGVDPGELFCTQFAAINHFVKTTQFAVLPLTGEIVFDNPFLFDTVFSMGVVSHRREPQQHLRGLWSCLKPKGELILETLVIEDPKATTLVPADRYANMRNVWVLPSVPYLINQVAEAGFTNIECIDVCRTTTKEQRSTEWMPSYSLENGLNPDNHALTKEGYPAPTRCVLIAHKP